jgi:hypothetical protein
MFLYLVKHSRPDISKATRELSKAGDGATESHWKQLLLFHLEGISDCSFSEDNGTRTNVYAFVVYFCEDPVATKQS